MKPIVIALKDLKQSFRSAFALMFMFVVPMLVTGMFALMFDSQPDSSGSGEAFRLPAAKLVIANMDLGDAALTDGLAASHPGTQVRTLGDALTAGLQEPALQEWLTVQTVASAGEARALVDEQAADAAMIIPAGFSASYAAGKNGAEASFYTGPSEMPGANTARVIIEQVLDGFAGARIALNSAAPDQASAVAVEYAQAMAQVQEPTALMSARGINKAEKAPTSALASIIAPIMGGMLIFFAFFTGGSTAQSILKETESGTLARMFTTPTRPATILHGKFLAVGLTVLVQVSLLLIAASVVFGIQWGTLPAVVMAAAGIITCAAAFGIFVTSLMKSTRQGGAVYGGLMTVTGMLGMLTIFAGQGGATEAISLLTPQGWAIRGLTLAMHGASLPEAALNLLVLVALSAVFMGVGMWKSGKRFA